MRRELPTGTVTFLFTDIEGSTRLLHALGAEAYATALATHRAHLRDAFAATGGVEVDTQGDAFLVAFSSYAGAAQAAAAAHAVLAGGPVRVRVGLHTGEPSVTGEGYVGEDVHRGARIAALAHGGQTLVSEPTAGLLAGSELRDLGLHRLKDFPGAARVFQLGSGDFPPLRTPGSVDLPTPATPFLGRQAEILEALGIVLDRDPRVLTILGPGGTGKTRFAIELARLLADEADGGTIFVPLAPLRDADLVVPLVAERLGAPTGDAAAIATRIGTRRTHVVLDNAEHLLPAAAAPVAELVGAAPALRVVVTSRESLRVQGEHELDLPPLADGDAVDLFCTRAAAVGRILDETDSVHRLCDRLDRLPLAIELAAARTKLIAPDALLERLTGALDLLSGTRDADPRHSTLRATIAWSYDLLEDEEKAVFAKLAVFRGAWTLEAAEQVCETNPETIASLLDKSLIRRRDDERFFLLETIREFARERVQADPALAEDVRRRHAVRVLDVARSANLSTEAGGLLPDHEVVLAEREELRAALDWATKQDTALAAGIFTALEQHWVTHAAREGLSRVEGLLNTAGKLPAELAGRLHRVCGGVLVVNGEVARGEQQLRKAIELFRSAGYERGVVELEARFVVHGSDSRDPDETRRRVAELRAANESAHAPMVEPQLLSALAFAARHEGDRRSARDLFKRSIEAAQACNFVLWEMWNLTYKSELELESELFDEAEESAQRALRLSQRLDDRRIMLWNLTDLARAALARGELERAGLLWGAVREEEASEPILATDPDFAVVAPVLDGCVDPPFLGAVESGRALSLEQAVRIGQRQDE